MEMDVVAESAVVMASVTALSACKSVTNDKKQSSTIDAVSAATSGSTPASWLEGAHGDDLPAPPAAAAAPDDAPAAAANDVDGRTGQPAFHIRSTTPRGGAGALATDLSTAGGAAAGEASTVGAAGTSFAAAAARAPASAARAAPAAAPARTANAVKWAAERDDGMKAYEEKPGFGTGVNLAKWARRSQPRGERVGRAVGCLPAEGVTIALVAGAVVVLPSAEGSLDEFAKEAARGQGVPCVEAIKMEDLASPCYRVLSTDEEVMADAIIRMRAEGAGLMYTADGVRVKSEAAPTFPLGSRAARAMVRDENTLAYGRAARVADQVEVTFELQAALRAGIDIRASVSLDRAQKLLEASGLKVVAWRSHPKLPGFVVGARAAPLAGAPGTLAAVGGYLVQLAPGWKVRDEMFANRRVFDLASPADADVKMLAAQLRAGREQRWASAGSAATGATGTAANAATNTAAAAGPAGGPNAPRAPPSAGGAGTGAAAGRGASGGAWQTYHTRGGRGGQGRGGRGGGAPAGRGGAAPQSERSGAPPPPRSASATKRATPPRGTSDSDGAPPPHARRTGGPGAAGAGGLGSRWDILPVEWQGGAAAGPAATQSGAGGAAAAPAAAGASAEAGAGSPATGGGVAGASQRGAGPPASSALAAAPAARCAPKASEKADAAAGAGVNAKPAGGGAAGAAPTGSGEPAAPPSSELATPSSGQSAGSGAAPAAGGGGEPAAPATAGGRAVQPEPAPGAAAARGQMYRRARTLEGGTLPDATHAAGRARPPKRPVAGGGEPASGELEDAAEVDDVAPEAKRSVGVGKAGAAGALPAQPL